MTLTGCESRVKSNDNVTELGSFTQEIVLPSSPIQSEDNVTEPPSPFWDRKVWTPEEEQGHLLVAVPARQQADESAANGSAVEAKRA